MSSPDTTSTTSSPVSGAGRKPAALPDGTARYGPAPAPASPSPSQGSGAVQMTLGIFGPTSSGSSPPASLSWSLVSRLQGRVTGSTKYSGTWKERVTPQGRSFWEHTPPVRRTSGNGSGGAEWKTPMDSDQFGAKLDRDWIQLREQVLPWQTPRADATAGAREPRTGREPGSWSLALTEQVVPWPSPVLNDARGQTAKGKTGGPRLGELLWPTCTARDWKDGDSRNAAVETKGLLGRVALPSGTAQTESSARARLNPLFCQWLMGYPRHWTERAPSAAQVRYAATETPSSRRSGRCSSRQ